MCLVFGAQNVPEFFARLKKGFAACLIQSPFQLVGDARDVGDASMGASLLFFDFSMRKGLGC